MNGFPAIRIEGGLLGPEVLEQLLASDLPGQKLQDFAVGGKRSLTDEIASVFEDARSQWKVFRHRLERVPDSDPATSITRDAWMIPFLSLLGYELRYNPRAYEVDGLSFTISHRAGENEDAPPVHIVGARQELGRVAPTGRPRLAPHSLVQEFLNRTEHLWGIVTNGETLRLLRDSTYIRRQAYVEFDLRQILEEQRFADFAILYRLLHRTRLPRSAQDARDCWLEQYYQHSLEQGGRVREHLRDGVEECLQGLADGFLAHPANQSLRQRVLAVGNEASRLSPEDLYRQLLRLVYRFLFLLVSEDRGLISADPIYREHYGIARLRRLLDRRSAYSEHDDLWCSLRVLWKVLSDERLAAFLGAAPLNGELFAPLDLDACTITNRALLNAFWHLAYYRETPSGPPRRVNYAALDVEELGSVYESLLEYHPQIDCSGAVPRFELAWGSERKSTGSYYTPPELVAELIRSALEPVIEERLQSAKTPEQKGQAILSIRVLDPACGSGHFLLAAARRLGKELARLRTGEQEPAPERVREAIRDVVAHCIYGVDKNPLAVELCRVALWLEAHCQGKPLTFLDHRIRCGDSLVGVWDLEALRAGLPDEAFAPGSGDDRTAASRMKRQNRSERRDLASGQLRLPFDPVALVSALGLEEAALEQIPDDSPELIRQKKQRYDRFLHDPEREKLAQACDLWTAAFFQRMGNGEQRAVITTQVVLDRLENRAQPQAAAQAEVQASRLRFFHWPLEFPEVFGAKGERRMADHEEAPHPHHSPFAIRHSPSTGFDVVLCNPPWERIKLQEEEFFATRDPEIARAPNKAERARRIKALQTTSPALWQEYQEALHDADALSKFLRASGRFPLTARGDINTYSVFAELFANLLRPEGRAGVVVPTGIATDATNQRFFAHLVESGRLVSLYDFENREGLFPAVDSRYKFSLLTLRGAKANGEWQREANGEWQREANGEWGMANGGEGATDHSPFAVRYSPANPWGVRFLAMFHMANDSHLFRTRHELEREGFRLMGNVFVKGDPRSPSAVRYSPLYEAKMIWHYDHRYGTYEGVASRSSTQLPTPTEAQHADPSFVALPWYWVPAGEVEERLQGWDRGWLLGWRDVARSTDKRTAIFSLLPRVGAGDTVLLMFPEKTIAGGLLPCLFSDQCSLPHDYATRQKIGESI